MKGLGLTQECWQIFTVTERGCRVVSGSYGGSKDMMHWYGPRTLDSRFRCDYELGRAGNERFGESRSGPWRQRMEVVVNKTPLFPETPGTTDWQGAMLRIDVAPCLVNIAPLKPWHRVCTVYVPWVCKRYRQRHIQFRLDKRKDCLLFELLCSEGILTDDLEQMDLHS